MNYSPILSVARLMGWKIDFQRTNLVSPNGPLRSIPLEPNDGECWAFVEDMLDWCDEQKIEVHVSHTKGRCVVSVTHFATGRGSATESDSLPEALAWVLCYLNES